MATLQQSSSLPKHLPRADTSLFVPVPREDLVIHCPTGLVLRKSTHAIVDVTTPSHSKRAFYRKFKDLFSPLYDTLMKGSRNYVIIKDRKLASILEKQMIPLRLCTGCLDYATRFKPSILPPLKQHYAIIKPCRFFDVEVVRGVPVGSKHFVLFEDYEPCFERDTWMVSQEKWDQEIDKGVDKLEEYHYNHSMGPPRKRIRISTGDIGEKSVQMESIREESTSARSPQKTKMKEVLVES